MARPLRSPRRRAPTRAAIARWTGAQAGEPACSVAEYRARAGIEVVPVSVYYPETTAILGKPVVRTIVDAGAIDLVDVFRRSRDVAGHLDDLLAAKPPAVWLQS